MKFLTAITLVTFFLMGCGSPNLDDPATLDKILAEAMDWDSLQKRGKEGEELYHAPNQQSPFTGWAKTMYANGQVSFLLQLSEGKYSGVRHDWYENGQKCIEIENMLQGTGYKQAWFKNGQKHQHLEFRDSLLISAETWKPNGETCPKTSLENGTGILISYYEGGSVQLEENFKNGKKNGLTTYYQKNGGKKLFEYLYEDGGIVE